MPPTARTNWIARRMRPIAPIAANAIIRSGTSSICSALCAIWFAALRQGRQSRGPAHPLHWRVGYCRRLWPAARRDDARRQPLDLAAANCPITGSISARRRAPARRCHSTSRVPRFIPNCGMKREHICRGFAGTVSAILRTNRSARSGFAGVHSNVGGGYPDDALAYIPLVWMMTEAQRLRFALQVRSGGSRQPIPTFQACDLNVRQGWPAL